MTDPVSLIAQAGLIVSCAILVWVVRRRDARIIEMERKIEELKWEEKRLIEMLNEERRKADLGPLGEMIDGIRAERDAALRKVSHLKKELNG